MTTESERGREREGDKQTQKDRGRWRDGRREKVGDRDRENRHIY